MLLLLNLIYSIIKFSYKCRQSSIGPLTNTLWPSKRPSSKLNLTLPRKWLLPSKISSQSSKNLSKLFWLSRTKNYQSLKMTLKRKTKHLMSSKIVQKRESFNCWKKETNSKENWKGAREKCISCSRFPKNLRNWLK